MRTALVTAPGTSSIMTLAETKKHLRMSTAVTVEDAYLKELNKLAVERIQDITGRKLMKQTWSYYIDDWPTGDDIRLPYSPLISIPTTGIVYKGTTGGSTTFGSTKWTADTVNPVARVHLDYGFTWPSSAGLYDYNPIYVTATYGYSTGSTSVPHAMKRAARILISDWYENRESFIIGRIVSKEVPNSVTALLAPYRTYNFEAW